jgi:hypothetical protein
MSAIQYLEKASTSGLEQKLVTFGMMVVKFNFASVENVLAVD